LVYTYGPTLPAIIEFNSGLRAELPLGEGYELDAEYLNEPRVPEPTNKEAFRGWLGSRFTGARPNIVVAVGDSATGLLASPEAMPWPGVPVVFGLVAHPEKLHLPQRVTGIAEHLAYRETIELAHRLFPASRHIVVVGGASAVDRMLAEDLRAAAGSFAGQLGVTELLGLPALEMEERLRNQPEGSIVLLSSYFVDGAGQPWTAQQIAARISEVARGPLFSVHGTMLGHGIVGGMLTDYERAGHLVGQLLRRIRTGEDPSTIPVRLSGSNQVLLDGRELDRWSVPDGLLPTDAVIRFRTPGVWSRYRWAIASIALALVCQALLIGGLLLERRGRRSAEGRMRENLGVIAHLNRVAAIGELAGAFAHEINSPLGAVVNNAQAARRLLAALPMTSELVFACLDDIVRDAGRVGDVVRRMRRLIRKEDVRLASVDIAAVIRDALRLVEQLAVERDVTISVEPVAPGTTVSGDDVQLVQVIINLVLNAIDAVADVPADRRRIQVGVAQADGWVEIQVADAGVGIPRVSLKHMFEPFYTTKPLGLGLGLSITRSVVEAHGGNIRISETPGGGTTFHVRLPTSPAADLPR
jgi:signal transduction histidine kinase